jgi:hypothetical protein
VVRALGYRHGEAICLLHLGQIAAFMEDESGASDYLAQSLAIARDIKYQEVEGACALASGELSFDATDIPQSVVWFEGALAVFRAAADKRGEANALRWLGKCDVYVNELTSARARLKDALLALRKFEMWDELLACLEDGAELLHREGHSDRAISVCSAVAKARKLLDLGRPPQAERRYQAQVSAYQRGAEASAFNASWKKGENWGVDDAVFNALRPTELAEAS